MLLTTAHRVLIAAALAEKHDITIGQAIDMADTVADALLADDPHTIIDEALATA